MRILKAFFPLAVALCFAACKEEKHGISYTIPEKPLLDTTYTISGLPAAQTHKILLYDVTGVRCVNCPEAARLAKKIADTLYPGRVAVLAVYPQSPAPLWWPWAGYDTMSNEFAEGLIQSLGGAGTLPAGCVDQLKISGNRMLDRTVWVSAVTNRLPVNTGINIELKSSWDNAKNRGRLEIVTSFLQDKSEKHLIFIAIAESHVKGKQSDIKLGEILDYEHNHALRKLYTANTGDTLRAELKAGRVFEKHYYINPRYNWKAENLAAIVWVVDASTKEVQQVAEIELKP